MYIANYLKYSQNTELRELLTSTTGTIEFKASTPFWNEKNSRILENIRDRLQFEI